MLGLIKKYRHPTNDEFAEHMIFIDPDTPNIDGRANVDPDFLDKIRKENIPADILVAIEEYVKKAELSKIELEECKHELEELKETFRKASCIYKKNGYKSSGERNTATVQALGLSTGRRQKEVNKKKVYVDYLRLVRKEGIPRQNAVKKVQELHGIQSYGFIISPCPPGEPQKKGRVESGVKYVKNNFVPLRKFRTLTDANNQLTRWLLKTAGNRNHGTTHQKPLTMFAETEKHFLKPLPDVPVQIATWTRVKVHGNCHVQFEKAYYSAPFRLVRQQLWLKATDTTVSLYNKLKLIAVHPRLKYPGQRSTIDEHQPPEALAYKMQDPQWCLKQAEEIGPECLRLIRRLFNHKVLDNLRAAQGVISLGKKYGPARLEAACARALHFDNVKYRTVKCILHQGLDQVPLENQTNVIPLTSVYAGNGRFVRVRAERGRS